MLAAVTAFSLGLTAACGGSAIDPETASAANRAVSGQAVNASGEIVDGTGVPASEGVQSPGDPGGVVGGSDPTTGGPSRSDGGTSEPGAPVSNPPAGSGTKAGSCDGFKNSTGITADTIKLGNASDISGPVPGLFTATQQATKAYVMYFNATNPSGICGRKLELDNQDSRTDNGADQAATTKFCSNVFATVGSMSAFDSGGAKVASECGLPEIRAATTTRDRYDCASCFSAYSTTPGAASDEEFDFFKRAYPTTVRKAAILYLAAGGAAEQAKTLINVAEKRGYNIIYSAAIDPATFNYGPYAQQLKSKGVQWVRFIGAIPQTVRLQQALQSAAYKPEVFAGGPGLYDPAYLKSGGSAVEGTKFFVSFTPFSEQQPELDLYKRWLNQVSPGAQPTFYGLFAWSAAKLFVQQAIALGGRLSRPALIASLRNVHAWTAAGMHTSMDVGSKQLPKCLRFMQVQGGKFVPLKGTRFTCGGITKG